jgi:predicted nucleotidyltransferase component of viral defense system
MKNPAASIRARLFAIAKKQNISFQLLVIRYFQERFLFRLSSTRFFNHFFLKGGVLLYAIEGQYGRPTLDIDFLISQLPSDQDAIKKIFQEICSVRCVEDGVEFDSTTIHTETIRENARYEGIRIKLTCILDSMRQPLQIDIGFGDRLVPDAVIIDYPAIFTYIAGPKILAYSIETVIAEKFQAMIELSTINSRMKDFFDVYRLLKKGAFRHEELKHAITATFVNRKTGYLQGHSLFTEEFRNDKGRLRLWLEFVKRTGISDPLDFAEVMRLISKILKPVWESMNPENQNNP